jgi:hypothetical protein
VLCLDPAHLTVLTLEQRLARRLPGRVQRTDLVTRPTLNLPRLRLFTLNVITRPT